MCKLQVASFFSSVHSLFGLRAVGIKRSNAFGLSSSVSSWVRLHCNFVSSSSIPLTELSAFYFDVCILSLRMHGHNR